MSFDTPLSLRSHNIMHHEISVWNKVENKILPSAYPLLFSSCRCKWGAQIVRASKSLETEESKKRKLEKLSSWPFVGANLSFLWRWTNARNVCVVFSSRWTFDSYKLVWFQMLVLQLPSDATPRFLQEPHLSFARKKVSSGMKPCFPFKPKSSFGRIEHAWIIPPNSALSLNRLDIK